MYTEVETLHRNLEKKTVTGPYCIVKRSVTGLETMTARIINYDLDEPEVGVTELIKTQASSSSTRREYLRMKAERALIEKAQNLLSPVTEETAENLASDKRFSLPVEDAVNQIQESEPEISSFPLAQLDDVDGAAGKKAEKHVGANEYPGHKHGAKLCMVSAMVHMKCLVQRKAKSIKELKKNPLTTQQEKTRNAPAHAEEDDSDSESEDELAYLNKCRYLRGTNEDKELSIEEIFG